MKHTETMFSVVPTVKYSGGGVTVRGAMSYRGTGFLTPLKGNLNMNGYLDIFKNSAIPSAHLLGYGDNFIFHATELTLSSSGNLTKTCRVLISIPLKICGDAITSMTCNRHWSMNGVRFQRLIPSMPCCNHY